MVGDSVDLPKLKGIGRTRKTRFSLYHHIQRGLHHADSISSIDSTNSKRLHCVTCRKNWFSCTLCVWLRCLMIPNSSLTSTTKKGLIHWNMKILLLFMHAHLDWLSMFWSHYFSVCGIHGFGLGCHCDAVICSWTLHSTLQFSNQSPDLYYTILYCIYYCDTFFK